jgi:hypothetical protein
MVGIVEVVWANLHLRIELGHCPQVVHFMPECPWACSIKLPTAVIDPALRYGRVFVTVSHFHLE